MIQSHLLPLQPPYNIIYSRGYIGRHIATLVVVQDGENRDQSAILGKDGRTHVLNFYGVRTQSYPIVSYDKARSPWEEGRKMPLPVVAPSDGIVWDRIELSQCKTLCQEDVGAIPWDSFSEVLNFHCNVKEDGRPELRIWELYNQLLQLGIDVDLPDGDVFQIQFDENKDIPLRPIFASVNLFGIGSKPYFPLFLSDATYYEKMSDDEKIDRLVKDIHMQMEQYREFFLYKDKKIKFRVVSLSNNLKAVADRLNEMP